MTLEKRNKRKAVKVDMTMDELMKQATETAPINLKDVTDTSIPEGATQIDLFKKHEIRKILHDDEWWYSIVDVVGAIAQTNRPSKSWTDLKAKIRKESGGNEFSENIGKLKMPGKDGKMYPVEAASAETLFRVIQSITSPNAEPFKKWLAKTAYERVLEYQNPEIAIKRAIASYQVQGRSDEWIKNRLQTIVSRNELTTEWKTRGVQEGKEYAALTDTIYQGTFSKTNKQYKDHKSLSKHHSLRDHMTGLELVLTMLGEEATKEIAIKTEAYGFYKNRTAARAGGSVAGQARKSIELETRKPVVSRQNFLKKKSTQPRLPEN